MSLDEDFGISLTPTQFEERFLTLHKQLFASTQFAFDDVTRHVFKPPKGMLQVDHSFIHDGKNWHLFYATGVMKNNDPYIAAIQSRNLDGASKLALEAGNGHAVGRNLQSLKFKELVQFESQGSFDKVARGVGNVFRCHHKEGYGFLYDIKGDDGQGRLLHGMSLAWSSDLENWELDERNPIFAAPPWAVPGGVCKDPHVMYHDGVYLIYFIAMHQSGYPSVGLRTTTDWETFHDEGAVFSAPAHLRGTIGIESPQVVHRDGIWHLFFTYGEGLQHAISPTPQAFVTRRHSYWHVGTGFYMIGPFHATEVIQDGTSWWLSIDRKEETRRLNRVAERLCYRGSYEDEKTLEEGLYLSEIVWKGDQPLLQRPAG